MKKILKISISLLVLTILITPAFSLAQGPLTPIVPPCDTNCGFNDLMILINRVVNFVLFGLALPLAAILFAYAGIRMLVSGGSEESRSTAKKIIADTAFGLIIAAAAWLIVNTILTLLVAPGPNDFKWIGFG